MSRVVLALTASVSLAALPATASAAPPGVYVVESGDTLIGIARQFGVRLADLLAANGLAVTSLIQPGQQLQIPGGSGSAPAAPSGGGSTYTVRAGDALATIASRHGVRLSALLGANGLTVNSVIHPGQQLSLPSGATPAPAAPAAAGGGSYTVQAGDSLSAIAARHGVTLAALLSANGISPKTIIHPGQQLTLPSGATPAPATPSGGSAATSGARYTVRAGDTLGAIARRHQVALSALLQVNGLTANSLIVPGQQLALPAGATVTPIDRVVNYALAQLGKPYQFFTKGPSTFDCSGLTLAAYAQIGVKLVHHSATQATQGVAVDFYSQPIQAGDLVFLSTDTDPAIEHVGLALGPTTWVQSRRPGDVVRISPLPPDGLITTVRRFV